MKSNYHTHNYRCNHAIGSVEDYVTEAIKEGFDEIGISDHLPHPGRNIDNASRMKYEDLSEYFTDIDEAINKYGDKISIKKGIECEYFPDYGWLYEELMEKHKVDYLLLGVHFFQHKGEWCYIGNVELTPESLECYIDHVITSMRTGLFKYIAHPDLFGLRYLNWDEHSIKATRRILVTAEGLDMPIEINVNGLRKPRVKYNNGERYKYPMEDFWKLAKEYKVKVIVGIDAHKPYEMKDLDMGLNFAKRFGLEVLDRLEFWDIVKYFQGNYIDLRLYFGKYKISVATNSEDKDEKSPYLCENFNVNNEYKRDMRFLVTDNYIESDSKESITLANKITEQCGSDMEKTKAIHDWVTSNVAYDAEAYL